MGLSRFSLRTTTRCELIDITGEVRKNLSVSGIREGLCCVYSPHTTAGITINENADPDVKRDILSWLGKSVPASGNFTHAEGNSDAHIKTLMTGSSVMVPVHQGDLVLGTWQGIYFSEFDGPRDRKVFIQIIG
jgi:secondary thiamine-phosphate synthase enzyme